jgi:hypothetical protein
VFRFDKFMDTVVKVMTRRDQVPSRAYEQTLHDLHAHATGGA